MNPADQQPDFTRPDPDYDRPAPDEGSAASRLYYFPQPSAFTPPAEAGYEAYRPTTIHRLPQARQIEPQPREITFGRVLFHLLLLGLTAVTTTLIGALFLQSLAGGMLFSFTLLTILGAHEMGHYIACRWYGVRATLPYFIPAPIGIGTFGAFIKIKSPIPTRRALFDIGIAGPLAGFVFALPAALIALHFAQSAPAGATTDGAMSFHDPLLFILAAKLLGVPRDIVVNPVWFAAWVGMLVTSLNLLPVGQLDGGHVTYSLFGPRGHRRVALATYCGVIALAVFAYLRGGWLGWAVYVVILTLMLRVGHPPIVDEYEPLGRARVLVAVVGLIVFLLCFLPLPITF
jgi:membrane-associated protease RseP (regulator of RpoE activity)